MFLKIVALKFAVGDFVNIFLIFSIKKVCATVVGLNHQEIPNHPVRVTNIRPFT